MAPRNSFKEALKSFSQQIGLWNSITDPMAVELMATCGYDWILFDAEHAAMDTVSVVPLLRAVAPYSVEPVVRPSSLNPPEIKRLLDFGARNLLVPFIRDTEEAHQAVSAVSYAPQGIRGVAGMTRASKFGNTANYHKTARDEICLILQIETVSAFEQIEEIAAIPGVDALFVGPADLAASMGFLGEFDHPDVKNACMEAIRRIRAAGLPAGILTIDPDWIAESIDVGSVFTAVDVDISILARGAQASAAKWNNSATTKSEILGY